MITKMKKLTFVVYHKEYESFLQQIRLLGVVHIVERQRGEMDETLQSYLQKRSLYKNLLTTMQRQAGEGGCGRYTPPCICLYPVSAFRESYPGGLMT